MSRKAISATLALLVVCLAPRHGASTTASRGLILEEIDEADLVTLAGNTRPEVQLARDLGPVSDRLLMSHMYLQMKMSPAQEADVATLISQLHDPFSTAQYHQWLSLAEIEDRFGPAREDIHKVSTWLELHGFTVNVVYPANGVIDFSGPAGAIREAFHTEIDTIDLNGSRHIANVRDPQIPAALAPAVVGVTSMNDFRPHPNVLLRKQFNTGNLLPFAVVPGDLAIIYDFNPVYKAGFSGKGQTVVVVEDSDIFSAADWDTFRRAFGLQSRFPFGSLTQVHPQPARNSLSTTCVDPGINSDDGEAEVDAEWSSAAAPNAAIVVATCGDTNTNFGGFIAMQNLLTRVEPPPGIISISYGASESQNGASFNAYINALYRLAVLRGVSVFVATGDAGADTTDQFLLAAVSGLNVSGFATTQYNVAVGGTDFADTFLNQNATYWNNTNGTFFSSAKSYIPEIPWNDSCAGRLASTFFGSGAAPYGAHGFCNSGQDLEVAAGSGGASSCFSGAPARFGIVGGTCRGYPKPEYQYQALGIPRDGVRDIPDVTMFASNGFWGHYYVFCYTDLGNLGSPCVTGHPEAWSGAGGTSFGAPIMAGVQALINESVGTRLEGNPNYVYYRLSSLQSRELPQLACNSKLGAKVNPSCVFHDVTFGDMDVNCRPLTNSATGVVIGRFNCYLPSGENGVMSRLNDRYEPTYSAKPGYDLASGIGSVDVFALVKAWPRSKLH